MLRDLEELLHTIIDDGSRDFMAEAVRCYQAGMYRAAVVMAVAAAMDELRRKLSDLVDTGVAGIDRSVVEAHARIDAKFRAQDAFEFELIETTAKLSMFSPAETVKLGLLLKTRHLCAHPSGHQSSAEEGRECIASLIDLVLARQPLMGITAVNSLVERLKQPHFFPMIRDAQRNDDAVRNELQPLLASSYPALAAKLVEALKNEAQPTTPPPAQPPVRRLTNMTDARENLRAFACSMLRVGEPTRRALWNQLGRLIEAPETSGDALVLLGADAAGLRYLEDKLLSRERALALVRRSIQSSDARKTLRGWRLAGILRPEETSEMLAACMSHFVYHWPPRDPGGRAELAWPELDQAFFARAIEAAGTNDFAAANAGIDTIQGLRAEEAATISPELRAKYVFNVARYSTGTYANNSARPLPTQGLGPRADFLVDFEQMLATRPPEARAMKTDWSALAKIISATGRADLLHKMLDMFVGVTGDLETWSAFQLGDALENHADAAVVEKARALAAATSPRRAQ